MGRRIPGELKEKAVAYLNVDSAVSGANFGASSVPSMWKLIRAVTRDIKDPKTGQSVYQRWQERSQENQPEAEMTDAEEGSDTAIAEARIGALGSGSDFTRFYNTSASRRSIWVLAATTASIIRRMIRFIG